MTVEYSLPNVLVFLDVEPWYALEMPGVPGQQGFPGLEGNGRNHAVLWFDGLAGLPESLLDFACLVCGLGIQWQGRQGGKEFADALPFFFSGAVEALNDFKHCDSRRQQRFAFSLQLLRLGGRTLFSPDKVNDVAGVKNHGRKPSMRARLRARPVALDACTASSTVAVVFLDSMPANFVKSVLLVSLQITWLKLSRAFLLEARRL